MDPGNIASQAFAAMMAAQIKRRGSILAVIVFSIIAGHVHAQYQPSWTYNNGQTGVTNQQDLQSVLDQVISKLGMGKEPTQQSKGSFNSNPADILAQLASLSKEELLVYLEGVGDMIMKQTGQDCNIFGGQESCMTLPSDSELARLCPNHNLKVDCMLYQDELQESQYNPVRDLKNAIEAAQDQDLENKCPECFKNQVDWMCASLVPQCGYRRAYLEGSFLPTFMKVMDAQQQGMDWAQSLATEMPALSKANSLIQPCREMCHSVVSTCACGEEKTFGQLLDAYSDAQTGEPLPAGLNKQAFSAINNVSFCSLFASSSEDGFAGVCQEMPNQCSNQTGWCDPSNPARVVAPDLMLRDLISSLSSYESTFKELHDTLFGSSSEWTAPPPAPRNSAEGSGGSSSEPGWGGVVLAFLGGAVTCGFVAAGYMYYRHRRRQQYREESHEFATEMAENEGLLDRT